MGNNPRDKALVTTQRWWERLRFRKFGLELANRFKQRPALMTELRTLFRTQNDKICYYDFFQFLLNKVSIQLNIWEADALETRLDRLGMAFIEFNEFNEFCMGYGINWGEPLLETDLEDLLDQKLNLSYQDYKLN